MDKYDCLILEIIHSHKLQNAGKERIRLRNLERAFWKEIEADTQLNLGQGRVGERITRLFMAGLIDIKEGYSLTGKGRKRLEPVE